MERDSSYSPATFARRVVASAGPPRDSAPKGAVVLCMSCPVRPNPTHSLRLRQGYQSIACGYTPSGFLTPD